MRHWRMVGAVIGGLILVLIFKSFVELAVSILIVSGHQFKGIMVIEGLLRDYFGMILNGVFIGYFARNRWLICAVLIVIIYHVALLLILWPPTELASIDVICYAWILNSIKELILLSAGAFWGNRLSAKKHRKISGAPS